MRYAYETYILFYTHIVLVSLYSWHFHWYIEQSFCLFVFHEIYSCCCRWYGEMRKSMRAETENASAGSSLFCFTHFSRMRIWEKSATLTASLLCHLVEMLEKGLVGMMLPATGFFLLSLLSFTEKCWGKMRSADYDERHFSSMRRGDEQISLSLHQSICPHGVELFYAFPPDKMSRFISLTAKERESTNENIQEWCWHMVRLTPSLYISQKSHFSSDAEPHATELPSQLSAL